MTIRSCFIRGFGCLTDREFNFSEGLNVFVWPNGEGKSTFSAFITAMLYGLPTARKGSAFTEREKYVPFAGGVFGGSLVMTGRNGEREVTYRIERTFDPRSATGDTLAFYVDGERSEIQDVGSHLVGVNEDTFRKVFFLNSEGMIPGGTDEISSRIANYMGTYGEQVPDALKRLDGAKKDLRKRGDRGVIPDIIRDLDSKRRERAKLISIKDRLGILYEELNRCKVGLHAAESERKRFYDIRNKLEKWKTVETLEQSAIQDRGKLEKLYASFGGRVPDEIETADYKENVKKYVLLTGEAKRLSSGPERNDVLAFKEQLPPEERCGIDLKTPAGLVNEYERQRSGYIELGVRTEALKNAADRIFGGRSGDDLRARISDAELSYAKARSAIEVCEGLDQKRASGSFPKAFTPFIPIIAGAIVAAASAAVYLFKLRDPRILAVGIALGVVCVLAGVFLSAAVGAKRKRIKKETEEACLLADSAVSDLSKDLAVLGYEGEPFSRYADMRRDLAEFERLSGELEAASREYDAKRKETSELENRISRYFRSRGVYENDFRVALYELERRDLSIREYDKSVAARFGEADDLAEEIEDVALKLKAFMTRYGIDTQVLGDNDLLNNSAVDVIVAGTVEAEIKEKLAASEMTLKGLKEGIGTDTKPVCDFTEEDVAANDVLISSFNEQIASVKTEIGDIESSLADLDRIDSDIAVLEEKLAQKETLYKALDLAYNKLETSQNDLVDRFIGPVRESFSEYSAGIRVSAGVEISLDKDLNVSFTKDGFMHGSDHLSTGERAAISLCLKLAVADFLTSKNGPFLLLDDPFTALDEKNFELSKKVLLGISGMRQMIYFTCHESRGGFNGS